VEKHLLHLEIAFQNHDAEFKSQVNKVISKEKQHPPKTEEAKKKKLKQKLLQKKMLLNFVLKKILLNVLKNSFIFLNKSYFCFLMAFFMKIVKITINLHENFEYPNRNGNSRCESGMNLFLTEI
jgi:hypothetical protein